MLCKSLLLRALTILLLWKQKLVIRVEKIGLERSTIERVDGRLSIANRAVHLEKQNKTLKRKPLKILSKSTESTMMSMTACLQNNKVVVQYANHQTPRAGGLVTQEHFV